MAEFRNVSGEDRYLALPDWINPELVEAGATVSVDDALVYSGKGNHLGKYDFAQPGVWEDATTKAAAKKDGK